MDQRVRFQFNAVETYLCKTKNSSHVRFDDCSNNLMAYIAGDMPAYMRSKLLACVEASFGRSYQDILTWRNSRKEVGPNDVPPLFHALHFTYYIRSGAKVRHTVLARAIQR